ncbi:MAG: glycosyltransferase [Limnothrix sp. RL_2_0]|nr:glycosyltransferase [Limnothrix sp. RL_2_0]
MSHPFVPSNTHFNGARIPRLMLFDLEHVGHHAIYISHLIRYWNSNQLSGELIIVVTPTFLDCHTSVVSLAKQTLKENVVFQPISMEEEEKLRSLDEKPTQLFRRFQEMAILRKYVRQWNVDYCSIMFIDKLQIPFVFGLSPSCQFSGIYFRPSFHYCTFSHHTTTGGWKEKIQHLREKVFIARLVENPRVHKLLCLDPFVSKSINTLFKTEKAITLPDPVEACTTESVNPESLYQQLGIEPQRKVFLVFGELSGRKGLAKTLEALETIEQVHCEQICLLIVGRIEKKKN